MKKYFYFFAALFGLVVASPASAMTCEYTIESGLQYGTGEMSLDFVKFTEETTEQKLLLDAYIPTRCDGVPVTGGLRPIEWVHGGGFGAGARNEKSIVDISKGLASNGFAVFSIDYRLVPNQKKKNTMPILEKFSDAEREAMMKKIQGDKNMSDLNVAQDLYGALISVQDSLKAKAWITANASRFHIAPDRFGLMGASAGAVSVLSQAYIADDLGFDRGVVTAVVDMFGTTQPLSYIEAGEAPLLVIHGTADTIIPYTESDKLVMAARAVNIPVERIAMAGVGHGLPNAGILRRKVDGTNESIISRVIIFFDQTLRCDLNCLKTPVTSDTSPILIDEESAERISFWHRLWNFILQLFR